jgi:hypothetical protein
MLKISCLPLAAAALILATLSSQRLARAATHPGNG